MNIVLCYPLKDLEIGQIRRAMPEASVTVCGQDTIADRIFEADIFCGHAKVAIDWARVVNNRRLKWIQSSAAGLDHCLVPDVIGSDILVSSASALFADPVAEQTLALIFGLMRGLPQFFHAAVEKKFERKPTKDVHGKTIGIVGFGGNGQRIAQLLEPLKNEMVAVDWFPEAEGMCGIDEIWSHTELNRLLQVSDIAILTVPLTAQTRHLLGESELKILRRGSYIINVSRGQVIDESALVAGLKSGHIAGAGLDVTETEPLAKSSPLWELPNVIITPHVGAQSSRRTQRTTQLFCANLARWSNGEPLLNLVDKSLGFPHPEHRVNVNTNPAFSDR